jgi:hypothetical protein
MFLLLEEADQKIGGTISKIGNRIQWYCPIKWDRVTP